MVSPINVRDSVKHETPCDLLRVHHGSDHADDRHDPRKATHWRHHLGRKEDPGASE